MREGHFHQSLRHKNIDYRRGCFFVTMQVMHNASLLGAIQRDAGNDADGAKFTSSVEGLKSLAPRMFENLSMSLIF